MEAVYVGMNFVSSGLLAIVWSSRGFTNAAIKLFFICNAVLSGGMLLRSLGII